MTPEQAFNRRIKKFLSENPESTASKKIKILEKFNPKFQSYYELFDSLLLELGISMIIDEKVTKKSRTIGYIPSLEYHTGNMLKEKSGVVQLINENSPLSLNKCYDNLAKNLLYRLMKVPNLEQLIMRIKY